MSTEQTRSISKGQKRELEVCSSSSTEQKISLRLLDREQTSWQFESGRVEAGEVREVSWWWWARQLFR